MKKMINCAHRGAMAYAPENTMKAFRLGIDMGADMLELDTHLTRDGVAIVNHNTDLKHTTPPLGRIAGLTYDEISHIRFRGEPIPTLEEVILLCMERGVELDIECKDGGAIEEVVRLVRKHGTQEHTLISQFNALVIARSRRLDPSIRTGFLTLPVVYPFHRLAALAAGAYSVNAHKAQVNRLYVEVAHFMGLKVISWTVDDADEMRRLIENGVDGIITNKPDLLAKIKKEMGVDQSGFFR